MPLVWFEDVDAAYIEARRRKRPVLVAFGASWDTASKELEHVTFPDPEVAAALQDYVLVRVDCSDDEERKTIELTRRFDIKGTPSLVIMHAAVERELARAGEFMPPKTFVPFVREAKERHDAIVVPTTPARLDWYHDVDGALAMAVKRRRPLLVFFGPAYDHGSKQIRDRCFRDPAVAETLHDDFVLVDVFCDQGANAMWDRFRVYGTPTSIVTDGIGRGELARSVSLVTPAEYLRFLREGSAMNARYGTTRTSIGSVTAPSSE